MCPWCGNPMTLGVDAHFDGTVTGAFYECISCKADSPYIDDAGSADDIKQAAYLAATATLPNLPLTRKQIMEKEPDDAIWLVNCGTSEVISAYIVQMQFDAEGRECIFFARKPTPADIASAMLLRGQTPCDTICDPQHAPACTQECIDACDVVNTAYKSKE